MDSKTSATFSDKVAQYKARLFANDKKMKVCIVTHGNCADGGFALWVTENAIKAAGYTVALVIQYFHNTDNFSKYADLLKEPMLFIFVDIRPMPKDYVKLISNKSIITIIDHHPFDVTNLDTIEQLRLYKENDCNILSITDSTQCATTLCCSVFQHELLTNPVIYHVNRFDNSFFEEDVTNYVGAYTKKHMKDAKFCETAINTPFIDLCKEGKSLYDTEQKLIAESLMKVDHSCVEFTLTEKTPDGKVHEKEYHPFICETVVSDDLLANGIAKKFYEDKMHASIQLIVTCLYKGGGIKFSFRSIPNITGIVSSHMARAVGGGGHDHCSAFYSATGPKMDLIANKPFSTYYEAYLASIKK